MKKNIIRLQECQKVFTTDQDKAIYPEDTVKIFKEKLAHLDLDILKEVKRIDNGRLGIPVYFSVCGEDARAMTGTKKQMGKGASEIQAQASACMELGERFSFFTFKNNPENFVEGDYQEMREKGYPVLDPEYLLQSVHDTVHDVAFVETVLQGIPMQWTWATHLSKEEEVLIPFSWFFAINEFNGPSAGNTLEEAALQGICEIVERHVCSLVTHEQINTPSINPESVSDPVAKNLLDIFKANDIELYLNDFSLDTGICTVGALAIDRSTFPQKSEIVYTAGTTPDPEKALIRAVTEVAQLAGDFNSGSNYVASGLPKPLAMKEVRHVTEPRASIRISEMANLADSDIRVEVKNCVEALAEKGMETFMINVSHPELQIPAIYTIVPGAHFRERSMIRDVGLFAAKLLVERVEAPQLLEERLARLEGLVPNTYYLDFYRGRNLYVSGDPAAALSHFNRALTLSPESEDVPYIYSYMGNCLKDLERYDEALAVLKKGLAEDEERPDIYNMMGVCYFKKEEYALAVKSFERAVELNPASAMDYANLGVNHRRLGNKEEALHFFTLALSLDPSIEFAQQQLADLVVEE
ncbi:MAG: YcaO-like family protein [Proteobacteria bacterium]|nr:YcaO-like family protein [Pseudomonadota bacterium]MBU1232240.1 YcaO-like family protein [Pseudomonadota bacterium]MBU1417073.1 YcaO-like family protein [Pseudomonadota bacterium]MBU1453769.1 YcaO-like family protein [Pseudomonadota bacterium]